MRVTAETDTNEHDIISHTIRLWRSNTEEGPVTSLIGEPEGPNVLDYKKVECCDTVRKTFYKVLIMFYGLYEKVYK